MKRTSNLFPDYPEPMIFGHRGAPTKAPENTLASFRHCLNGGIAGIELDIHQCSSGELVVIHDFNTHRLTGRNFPVEETSWRILKELDIGSWFSSNFADERIPLLKDVFNLMGDSVYYDIEIKDSTLFPQRIAKTLAEIISDYKLENRCMVSSFNPFAINAFKNCNSQVPTAIIYSDDKSMPFIVRNSLNKLIGRWNALKPRWDMAERLFFPAIKLHTVIPWTVDDSDTAAKLIKKGARGIITNKPEAVYNAAVKS